MAKEKVWTISGQKTSSKLKKEKAVTVRGGFYKGKATRKRREKPITVRGGFV